MRKPRRWGYYAGVKGGSLHYGDRCVGVNHMAEFNALWRRAVRILNAAEAKPKRARRKKK